MPIRMTDDPYDPNQQDDDGGGGRRPSPGGGAGLGTLLPLILNLFKGGGGKGLLILLALGAGAFFLLNRGGGGCNASELIKKFSQSGYSFSPGEFDKAKVYEGLDENNPENQAALPEAVSLLRFAPNRLNQGQQGSCVAWSSAYASQTILTAAATGQDPNQIAFSPSYLYNQIKLEGCEGSYIEHAMESMSTNGGVPLREYPYNDQDCAREPGSGDIQKGRQNLIHGFTRITDGDNINEISIRGIKEHLAKNAPVAIGMMVGQSFMQDMMGQELWTPQGMDESGVGMGGHAMSVIGYDDRKFGGAFQLMNSWGPEWGQNGIGWVKYSDFKSYVREAYGLDPLPKRSEVANIPLECTIGLVNNEGGQNIALRLAGPNTFQTTSPIKIGTRFKLSIKNATECYIYVFGAETNNSSYVLFPYLKPGETVSKHSPYCGITGYRLFPRAQSFEADSIGNHDQFAIVVSKDSLDYNQLNDAINKSGKTGYGEKVNEALQSILIRTARFGNGNDGSIYFKVDANTNKAVACVVEVDKK